MIEIITASFFVFSSIYGGPAISDASSISTGTPKVMAPIEEKTEKQIPNNKGLEDKVRKYFEDDPILADIASCESHFRQYDKEGNALRGKINASDIGLMQINEFYHLDKSKSLGLDIYTPEGNLAYAKYLYEKEGAQPWVSSSICWRKMGSIKSTLTEIAINK
jgi:hypothetical protein